MTRPSGRAADELRSIEIKTHVNKYAPGSCLIKWGDTHVLCTVMIEDKVPSWMKQQQKFGGWLTAEYGMLPHAGNIRKDRDAVKGKQDSRAIEIQRLIGRSLRAVVDLHQIPNKTIKIDCDVLQADGGTRTASITAAYIALKMAVDDALAKGSIEHSPIVGQVAAVSCGVINGEPVLDLDYAEDSNAGTDANFVMTADGKLIEIQGSAEGAPFSKDEFAQLLALAEKGIQELIAKQNDALK
ncbi:MAG: ribonuclease PH [Alphaproteobacteria bacterium]|nr:ribonuclease PH [Alphaproteobacteria bacterium]